MPITGLKGAWPNELNFDVFATNRTGATLAAGAIVKFDLAAAEETVGFATDPTSIFSNVIATGATAGGGGIFAVALESIADNAEGKFRVRGITTALIPTASVVAAGNMLTYSAGELVAVTTAVHTRGTATLGVALTAAPNGVTGATVLFDGMLISAPFVPVQAP